MEVVVALSFSWGFFGEVFKISWDLDELKMTRFALSFIREFFKKCRGRGFQEFFLFLEILEVFGRNIFRPGAIINFKTLLFRHQRTLPIQKVHRKLFTQFIIKTLNELNPSWIKQYEKWKVENYTQKKKRNWNKSMESRCWRGIR